MKKLDERDEYQKAADMGMRSCSCGSHLVYPAFEREEKILRGDNIVLVKHYRGACTECGKESQSVVGKHNAIQKWNKAA